MAQAFSVRLEWMMQLHIEKMHYGVWCAKNYKIANNTNFSIKSNDLFHRKLEKDKSFSIARRIEQ